MKKKTSKVGNALAVLFKPKKSKTTKAKGMKSNKLKHNESIEDFMRKRDKELGG